MKYKCLSIAGFDGSGGAGLQADLKTFSALGCYGMTVLTALPVQNTCAVRSCYDISSNCIYEQLEAIFDDITPNAIKIGMLHTSEIILLISNFLSKRAKNIPIILDPVMVAKSGHRLLDIEAIETLKTHLIPIASIITPNLPEAKTLIPNIENNIDLAKKLLDLKCPTILLKGGHNSGPTSDDIFAQEDFLEIISSPRIDSKNTHGTGCTLSSAITCFIAKGHNYFTATNLAKEYLQGAILASKDDHIGKGLGPVNHFYKLWEKI